MTMTKLYPTKKEIYAPSNYFVGINEEIDKAVERVKTAYEFSQRLGLGKLYVCFSGGKVSGVGKVVGYWVFVRDLWENGRFIYR